MLLLRARKSSHRPSSSLERDEEEGASRKLPHFCVFCFSFLRNVFFTMVAFLVSIFFAQLQKILFCCQWYGTLWPVITDCIYRSLVLQIHVPTDSCTFIFLYLQLPVLTDSCTLIFLYLQSPVSTNSCTYKFWHLQISVKHFPVFTDISFNLQ